MSWLKENWFKLGILLALFIAILGALFFLNSYKTETKDEYEGSYESSFKQELPSNQMINETPDNPVEKSHEKDLDSVLINYKFEEIDAEELLTKLFNLVENNPSQVCSAIFKQRLERQHMYYVFLDKIYELENKYDGYKNVIQYIGNSMTSFSNGNKLIQQRCASVGFSV